MKQLTAEQIFGEALLHRALKMHKYKTKMTHYDYKELVEGDMHKIDQRTGQFNDASYMAYLLEHVVGSHNG
jgi:hypothetical protein